MCYSKSILQRKVTVESITVVVCVVSFTDARELSRTHMLVMDVKIKMKGDTL